MSDLGDWDGQCNRRVRLIEKDLCPVCRAQVGGTEFDPNRLQAMCENKDCPIPVPRLLVRDSPDAPWQLDESVTHWRYRPVDAPPRWAAVRISASVEPPAEVWLKLADGVLHGTLNAVDEAGEVDVEDIKERPLYVTDPTGEQRIPGDAVIAYALEDPLGTA